MKLLSFSLIPKSNYLFLSLLEKEESFITSLRRLIFPFCNFPEHPPSLPLSLNPSSPPIASLSLHLFSHPIQFSPYLLEASPTLPLSPKLSTLMQIPTALSPSNFPVLLHHSLSTSPHPNAPSRLCMSTPSYTHKTPPPRESPVHYLDCGA